MKLKNSLTTSLSQFINLKKPLKKLITHSSIGVTILFFAGVSLAYGALTFSGTAVTGDGAVSVDGASTISIGTITAPDVTIGKAGHTTTFPGDVTFNGTVTGITGITGATGATGPQGPAGADGSGGGTATGSTYECVFPPSTCTITHNLNSSHPVIGIPVVVSGSSYYSIGNYLSNSFDVTDLFPADIIIPIFGTTAAATDFSLAVSPSSQSIVKGGSAVTYTVTQAQTNGYSGTVTLSCPSLPTGVTCSFSPTTISGSGTSTLTVNASGSASIATDSLTVSGTDGTLTHASPSFSLVVSAAPTPDFSLAISPSSQSIVKGGSAVTYTVTQTAIASYSGTVTLSCPSLPTGVTCSFSPTTISGGGTSTVTVNASGSATVGSDSLTVSGTDSTLTHATPTFTLVVSSAPTPDFSLAVSPSSKSITQGGAGVTYTVTQTAIASYSGTVTLSCPGAPTGVSCSFSPTTISGGGTSTVTVSASGSAALGSNSFAVSGTDGTLTHAAASSTLVVSGLVQHWLMNEGTSPMADSSGHTNNLTNTNATYTNMSGLLSNTLTFNGTNTTSVAANSTNTNFDGSTPFSVCAWVRETGNVNASNSSVIAGDYTGAAGWILDTTGFGTPYLEAYMLHDGTSYNQILYLYNPAVNTTFHTCFTTDGTGSTAGMLAYVNGSPVNQYTLAHTNLSGSIASGNPVALGAGVFTGGIADVRIYNYALSSGEVSTIYSGGPQ